jgi:hypothetical protein
LIEAHQLSEWSKQMKNRRRLLPDVFIILILSLFSLSNSIAQPNEHTSKGPYLLNVTSTGVDVCWVTPNKSEGKVACETSAAKGKTLTFAESAPSQYHRVHLTHLSPFTHYRYHITSIQSHPGGEFVTAPADGSSAPFTFAVYGDNRSQPEIHAAIIRLMAAHPYAFVLHTGDMVASGANQSEWQSFFDAAEPLLRNCPIYPELGNHEDEASPYFRYFPLPRDYSFRYGDALIVGIDTNRPPSEYNMQEQGLRKVLASDNSVKWKIVFMHHTPCTCVTIRGRREEAARLRARLEPIFRETGVQIVFSGHDHNYQRHFVSGIHYVVTGGGGAPLYPLRANTPYVQKAISVYNYCTVQVNKNQINVKAFSIDGKMIDTFTIFAAK